MKRIAYSLLAFAVVAAALFTVTDLGATKRAADTIVVAGNCDPQVSRCQ